MSVFSRPFVSTAIARSLQAATGAGATRMAVSARGRLPEFVADIEKLEVPTRVGTAKITIYRAANASSPTGALPAVHINLHGGGYVLALTDMDDPVCRALAVQSGSVVINVDYVVAPQHPFPAPSDQVFEVMEWVAANGEQNGWDGSRLTIGGQSAGGGLAAAVARLAFERGGPRIALQVLHYPPLDLSVAAGSKRSPIARPMLRPWMGEVYDTAYVPDPGARTDRLVSPAGAADRADLTGIAPAVIVAAEQDILRDEARRYADRLDAAGSLVEYREVAGSDHGYDLKDDERARNSYRFIAAHIRQTTA